MDYLLKPIDADQLFSAVETAINQWERKMPRKANLKASGYDPVHEFSV